MTQQTLREKIQHEMEISVYGFYCRRCMGGGANVQDKCELCNGTGIVDWNYDIAIKEIIKQVIEWVDKEVIGKDTRHATNTKDIKNIVKMNEVNVSEDEIINELQKDIDAQNELRTLQRQKLQQLKEKV